MITPSPSYGQQRQLQVYTAGLQGQRPSLPVAPEDLEQAAIQHMSHEASGYLDGMAESMRANREAFRHWHIVPRMLRDVSQRDLSVQLFDLHLPTPIMLAPIGVQSIVNAEAEVAVARAAASLGVPLVISTASTLPLEQVAQAMGAVPRWFQLYWSRDPEFNASVVRRAEVAGCSAIVVTLDTFLLAWRERDIQNAYLPFLLGQGLGNYFSDPAFRQALAQPPELDPAAAIQHFLAIFSNPSLTWKDLAFLREHTRLPILLKGVLHPDDALHAIDAGMNGIIVSNAIKTIALGAKAVLLGRPYMWGLALAGEQGVREVLSNFLADLDLTLALSGYASFGELDGSALTRANA